MKFVMIIAALGIVFFIAQVYMAKTTNGIETYPYKVIKKYDGFEVRKYEASNFAYVKMPESSYRKSSGSGFRYLAGYIFGGNEKNQKIAMTSPVAMNMEDSVTMMFMVPSEYEMKDLPRPNDAKVKFKQEPEKTVAAISFGGWANDEKIEKYSNKLVSLLEKEGISYAESFSYLGYNPPYEVINRKNEVIVELID